MRLHIYPSRLTAHLHVASLDCWCEPGPFYDGGTVVSHLRLPEEI